MNERDEAREIREALRDCLSGVGGLPSVREDVLRAVRGGRRVRRKLPATLAIALALTMLAAVAAAAAWLSMRELVEQEAIPLALENDGAEINETFTNEELAHIIAVAQENGVAVPQDLMEQLERGEGYWEEETIMALAKAEFGPIPARWTLEQQYWFEETVVAIGFKDVNYARIPGEGDLTYEQALGMAESYLAAHYGADPAQLGDPALYALSRGYHEYNPGAFTWYFWFEPLTLDVDEYIVSMDRGGNVTEARGDGTEEKPRGCTYLEGFFTGQYGSFREWDTAVWPLFAQALREAPDLEESPAAQRCARTNYLREADLPKGALTRADAEAVALDAARESEADGVFCAVLYGGGQGPVWKVTVGDRAKNMRDGARMVEVDAATGEAGTPVPVPQDMDALRPFVAEDAEDAAREID